jgi:hypothetical protein
MPRQRSATDTVPISEWELGGWLLDLQIAGRPERDHGLYEWLDAEGGPYLIESEIGGGVWIKGAATLAQPVHRALWTLYRTLDPVDAQRVRQAIVNFAGRYGRLGVQREEIPTADPQSEVVPVRLGERYSRWTSAIGTIGRLVSLWDLVRQGSDAAGPLGRQIIWRRGRVLWRMRDPWGGEQRPIGIRGVRPRLQPDLFDLWDQSRDSVAAARYVLAERLNEQLRNSVSPTLMPLRTAPPGQMMVGRLRPIGTLATAYVELYLEITGTRRFRECEAPGCAVWFDGRDDKRHCDGTCRKRALRARSH